MDEQPPSQRPPPEPALRPDRALHWQGVYQTNQPAEVSWYQPHLAVSMALLKQAGLSPLSRVIDVGGGAGTLVDDLLEVGVRDVTVLDVCPAALQLARQRLGDRATQISWLVSDVLSAALAPARFDLWHDRAALHFLVDDSDAAAYVALASRALAGGGYAVIGCFAADGPERCSQLPVARRDPEQIAALFGAAFTLVHAQRERHLTPRGATQSFAYALLRRQH